MVTERETMETRYKVTATRKGDRTGQCITFHPTNQEAEQWALRHMTEENNSHAYQIMKQNDTDEGWQGMTAYYIVDERVVEESEWIKAVKGQK
jgi:hypothetical protein